MCFCFFCPRRPQGCNDSGVKEILGKTPSVAKTRKWHFSPDWDVKSSWQVMVLVCMQKPTILTIVLFYGFFGASFFVKQSHQIQLKVNLLTELIWHENQRKLSFTLFVLLHVCTLYIPELNKYLCTRTLAYTNSPKLHWKVFLTWYSLFIFNDLVHLFLLSVCFVVRKYFNTLWTLIYLI